MEKLGYVVSERKIDDLKDYVGCVNDISLADPTKPILIVGLKAAKEYCGEKFSILNKQISDNVWWTFKKTEKRQDFERDILLFNKNIINNILNYINYYYIDLYNIKYNKLKKIYNIIFDESIIKYIYIKNNMIYMLYGDHDILGFSLEMLKYAGIKRKKVYLKVRNAPNTIINFDSSQIARDFRGDLKGHDYVFPYLMMVLGVETQ